MRGFRKLLSFPVVFAVLFVAGIVWLMSKTSSGIEKVAKGTGVHIYQPLLMLMRWVKGMPTWQPIDAVVGLWPRTKAQRAYAESVGFVFMKCTCGDPNCSTKDGAWVPSPPPGILAIMRRQTAGEFVTREEIEEAIRDHHDDPPPSAAA